MVGRWVAVTLYCCCVLACGDDDDDSGADGDADVDECDERNDQCTRETICIDGGCEDAFGRIYRISNIEVSLPDRDDAGEAWDVFGGMPDPFVVVWLGEDEVLATAAEDDSFDALYPDTGDVEVPAGATLELDVWDEDVDEHDLALACVADPLEAGLLRGRVVACENELGVTLLADITPR